jgi:hypothetical protein
MDEERLPPEEEKAFALLSRAEKGLEITLRDDQHESASILDAARTVRKRGGRLRLIDTGRFSAFELEWLAEAGADLYTSDEARPNPMELGLLAKACARGGSVIAYFHRGALVRDPGEGPTSPAFLAAAGREGIDIHVSNRDRPLDPTDLAEIAHACGRGGSRLVYYHHGPFEPGLEALARSGGWIHLSDVDLPADAGTVMLMEIGAAASASGSGLVIHLEKGLTTEILSDLLSAGVFVVFMTPPASRRSTLGALEREARKRALDRRSYYLYADFLP